MRIIYCTIARQLWLFITIYSEIQAIRKHSSHINYFGLI